jgi:hypothetical protein
MTATPDTRAQRAAVPDALDAGGARREGTVAAAWRAGRRAAAVSCTCRATARWRVRRRTRHAAGPRTRTRNTGPGSGSGSGRPALLGVAVRAAVAAAPARLAVGADEAAMPRRKSDHGPAPITGWAHFVGPAHIVSARCRDDMSHVTTLLLLVTRLWMLPGSRPPASAGRARGAGGGPGEGHTRLAQSQHRPRMAVGWPFMLPSQSHNRSERIFPAHVQRMVRRMSSLAQSATK